MHRQNSLPSPQAPLRSNGTTGLWTAARQPLTSDRAVDIHLRGMTGSWPPMLLVSVAAAWMVDRRVSLVRQWVVLGSSVGGIGRQPVRPALDLAEAELLVDRESHFARHQKRPAGPGI
jgi:hypothetical protein